MEVPGQQRFSFGPFVLDPTERTLWRDGHAVSLPLKACDTLIVLVERHGHIVEKTDLLNRVWPDTFIEEATLAQNIFTVRKLLGESSDDRQYIETVPRRGYRFIAPVVVQNGEASPTAYEPAAEPRKIVPFPRPARQATWKIITATLLLALCVPLGWYAQFHGPAPAVAPPRVMLAVLPFQNLTGDPQQDYLSDGFTEEMITQLGRFHADRLGVIARTSAMRYQSKGKTAGEIARELHVDYVVEGSLRREGSRVRISAQLIEAADQTHVWAASYDRDLNEVLNVESEVAAAIAREIEIKLPPAAQARLAGAQSTDPATYQLYLQARFLLNQRTAQALNRSVDLFEQTVSRDPGYAPAYAGMADSYILQAALGIRSPVDAIPKARAAALRAIEIDEAGSEAHASMGFILSRFDWNWLEAEREYQRAIELNPSYTTAHHWYALHLIGLGRSAEAIAQIQTAQGLDPASPLLDSDAGLILFSARQYSSARKECEKALALDPNFGLAHRTLGMIEEELGLHSEALAQFQAAQGTLGDDPWMMAEVGRTYYRSGNRKQAEKSMRELRQLAHRRYVSPLAMALLAASLDPQSHEVYTLLERAYDSRINLSALVVDPAFDGIRKDARFHELLHRAGLPEIARN